MKKNFLFRSWFYFRQGWTTYFAFLLAAINTLTVTYYLAIEKLPELNIIFPSFSSYLLTAILVGIPFLIAVGYIHYKKSSAYEAEADINVEAYPYYYKLPPGWHIEVLFPLYQSLTSLLIKMSKNEKISDDELKKLEELQKKIDSLLNGNFIGESRWKNKK